MKTLRAFVFETAVVALLAAMPSAAAAQTGANSGQIVGQLVDASGAAIVGADITVHSEATNLTRKTTSDGAGRYAVSLLPLGSYTVTATAAGLSPATETVPVTLGASVSANFMLNVAGVSEDVQVGARNAGIERTGTQGKAVLTDLQLQNLPASGRRVRSLFLYPGTRHGRARWTARRYRTESARPEGLRRCGTDVRSRGSGKAGEPVGT